MVCAQLQTGSTSGGFPPSTTSNEPPGKFMRTARENASSSRLWSASSTLPALCWIASANCYARIDDCAGDDAGKAEHGVVDGQDETFELPYVRPKRLDDFRFVRHPCRRYQSQLATPP
jgi:hypothetical protein